MASLQITKCGRYGPTPADFDYSPSAIRRSVQRSLERLDTAYLDVVSLHDVEMVADEVVPKRDGDHSTALGEDREAYGLAPGQEGKILGEGDRKVLEAYGELKRLKEEGLVKNIGITGTCSRVNVLPDSHRTLFRVSIANAPEAGIIDSTDAWADGRDDVLLPPHDPERHACVVCEGAHRESRRRAASHRLTVVYGIADSEPTGVEPGSPETKVCILRGRWRMFHLARRTPERRAGFCLSKC